MAKYLKPEKLNLVWNSLSPSTRATPDSSGVFSGDGVTMSIQEGWSQIKPPYEIENWVQNQHAQFNAYINQLGFPEWDSDTEYQSGKSYIQGSDNRIYKCILTHRDKNPASGNPSYWELFEGNRQATTTARGTVELATDAEVQAGTSDSLAVTPSALKGILEVLFPVGSVAIRPSNPGNTIANGGLGFGTWTRVAGRHLIGAGSGTDSSGRTINFSTGATGGVYRQTLTVDEMPRHRHTGTTSSDTHNHTIPESNIDDMRDGDGPGIDSGPEEAGSTSTSSDTHNHSFTTSYEGNGEAFDVTSPFIVVDMWRRTA